MNRSVPDALVVSTRRVDADAGVRSRRRLAGGVPDRVVIAGLLVIAAVLRFVFLEGRGTWDADQGHDMLVLQALVFDGSIPLLGPPTSIGDFHHGAAYYYLLAPFAFLSGADPTIVVAALAAAGTAAVGIVWWLVRAIAGPLAGAIAGFLLAVSPTAIEASTFLWNPNAIGLTASVALAAAWRAQATGRARWWFVAAFALGLTMQLHVLAVGLVVPIVGLFAWSWQRTGAGPDRRRVAVTGLVGLGLIAIQYVPLAIHELTSDFSEVRALLAYFAGSGTADQLDPITRYLFVFLRIVSWPIAGLITNAAIPGLIVAFVTVAIVVWRWRAAEANERHGVRWLGLSIAWSALFLAIAGRGLTTVVPGLPNDHYHAFVDPMVIGLVAIGLAGIARGRSRVTTGAAAPESRPADARPADARVSVAGVGGAGTGDAPGRTVVAIAIIATTLVGIGQWPPVTAADGGWPAAREAGGRIVASTGERPILLVGLPLFKSTGAYAFPLVHGGRSVTSLTGPEGADDNTQRRLDGSEAYVVACDRLFESVLLADCGGVAEDRFLAGSGGFHHVLVDRFEASTRTVISVYLPIGESASQRAGATP